MDGHSAPHIEVVAGPMQTSPCGTRHKSFSGTPSSNCLTILSMAIPSGGFSLGHTSQRLVFGKTISFPVSKFTIASAATSDLQGHPGMARSTSIASASGLTLLSSCGMSSCGIVPSGLMVLGVLM